jgi:ribosomal-protein-serine acetyltransferase
MLTHALGNDAELRLMMPYYAEALSALTLHDLEYLSRWLSWATPDFTAEAAREFINRYLQRLADDSGLMLGIFWRDQFAGWISHRWDRRVSRTELGYWIGQEFQGKGLVTQAVRAMTAYAFGELGLQRAEIMVEIGNTPSAAVAQRAGYWLEGVRRQYFPRDGALRDMEVYVLLASELAAAKA